MNKNIQPPHVVIIGAGFGGLRAGQVLARTAVQITLIDRFNYHLFQPLLSRWRQQVYQQMKLLTRCAAS